MAAERSLIVNADDFGQSPSVNRGIIESHEHGIVTSASLMVRWPAAPDAADYSRGHPNLSLGLHVDLGEWAYRDGTWVPVYAVVPLDDVTAVADEVCRQLAAFRRLTGQDPTHIDSHQHVHRSEGVRSVLCDLARGLVIPLRHYSSRVRYCGDFYGQRNGFPLPDAISADGLIKVLAALPAGLTELGCHPGEGNDLDTMYGRERVAELNTLCDPRVRAAIGAEGIALRSFRNLAPGSASGV